MVPAPSTPVCLMPDDSSFVYVDTDATVYHGSDADLRLRARAGVDPFEPGRGVTRVERERWEEAQLFELTSWLRRGTRRSDDHNHLHAQRFAGYSSIRGRKFARGIELGCGPFTNMRVILEQATVGEVHLLDPLVEKYLEHPFCRYANGRLGGIGPMFSPVALTAWRRPAANMADAFNRVRVGGVTGREVQLHATPIEDFQTSERFDLVVMLNVIEHCRDTYAIFEKIRTILEPGGVFIFEDKIYNAQEIEAKRATTFDAGHPLQIDVSVLDEFLTSEFDPLMRAVYVEPGRGGKKKSSLYFIGEKKR